MNFKTFEGIKFKLFYLLQRKHREIYLSIQKPSEAASTCDKQSSIQQFVTPTKKYSPNDPRQTKINDAIVTLIAGDLLPLSLVESDNFRHVIGCLDNRITVPSRKHFTSTILHNKTKSTTEALRLELQKTQAVCLAIDLWSSRQMRGFLGITGHYILDWSMKSVMFACSRFRGRHTADNIAQQVDETIACFDLGRKITNIVTDNAANMVKAFTLPGFEDIDTESDININDDTYDDVPEAVDISEDIVREHDSCFAHTLQLVVKDGFKEAGAINKVLAKASSIVSHVRRSTHATEVLDGEIRLQTANATRWNSQLMMIRSILRVSEEKLQKVDCSQLTRYERNIMEEMCDILGPFEHATNLVQGQNIVTSSLVIPCVKGMKVTLQKLYEKYNSKFVKALRTSFEKRMSSYETDVYILATSLDPRFKLKWCTGAEHDEHKSLLLRTSSAVQLPQSTIETLPEIVQQESKRPKLEYDLLDMFMEPGSEVQSLPTPAAVESEITRYLNEPCCEKSIDPLSFWQLHQSTFPHLSYMAQRYLAVPASSAAVERLFSIGGKIFRPERCRLSDKVFEQLMFLRCNAHLNK